jgi:hypothetical protein
VTRDQLSEYFVKAFIFSMAGNSFDQLTKWNQNKLHHHLFQSRQQPRIWHCLRQLCTYALDGPFGKIGAHLEKQFGMAQADREACIANLERK